MTPRERLLQTIRGDVADRVPLILEGFNCAGDVGTVEEPAKREILERVVDELPYFRNHNSRGNRYLMTPSQRIGQRKEQADNGDVTTWIEIDTPRGKLTAVSGSNSATNTNWSVKYPVESLEDIEKIRSVPWEMPEGLVAPDLSDVPDCWEARGVLAGRVSSPFVCVAGMMPYEFFLELCITGPALIKELTEQCLERVLNTLDVCLANRNVDYVWMGGSEWVTPPMASPRIYKELVQPFERQVIERIHAAGAVSHVHCHGNVRSVIELVIERGADFFEPVEPPPDGDITFAEAKQVAAGRITLGGNVEARILEYADGDTVEAATRAAFEGGKTRMVLQTTAGPIGPMTPLMTANYHRMIDVWEELSPI